MNARDCRRRGMTILEIVVVVGIVAIAAAIAVPSVLGARESARKASCANNLKQLGIAVNSYESLHGLYPPGANGDRAFSLHSMLLPHMNNFSIYNSINYHVDPYPTRRGSLANETAGRAGIGTFLCPSDSARDAVVGATSYAGNFGSGYQEGGFDGLFASIGQQPVKVSNIYDGTSSTAAMSEWALGDGERSGSAAIRLTFRTPVALTGPDELDRFAGLCAEQSAASGVAFASDKGWHWMVGDPGKTLYNHVNNINNNSCTNHSLALEGAWTAGSFHRSGAHTLFADGSVKYIRDAIDLRVWRAIATRSGRETVSSNNFY